MEQFSKNIITVTVNISFRKQCYMALKIVKKFHCYKINSGNKQKNFHGRVPGEIHTKFHSE